MPTALQTSLRMRWRSTIRSAARVCSNFATLRFRIMEIAELVLTQVPAATRRDLLDALADAEF
jgi:hypothetical protein